MTQTRTINFHISRDERDTLLRGMIELRENDRQVMDDRRRQYREEEANAIYQHIQRIEVLIHNLKCTVGDDRSALSCALACIQDCDPMGDMMGRNR